MNGGARLVACVAGLLAACSRGEPPVAERSSTPTPPPDCGAAVSNAQIRAASRIDHSHAPAPGQRQRALYFGVLGDSARRRHLYEFEVDSQVRRIDGESSASTVRNARALVQFVVDSLGAVDTSTVKVIAARGRSLTREAAVEAVREWRYQPARIDGCVVAQLIQVELP